MLPEILTQTHIHTPTFAGYSLVPHTQSQAVTLWLSHVNVKPFTYVPTSLVFTVNVCLCVHVSVSVGNICQHHRLLQGALCWL